MYSSEHGRLCPRCGQRPAACQCRRAPASDPAGDGIVRVGRSSKGRRGKTVTVVTGLPLDEPSLRQLAQDLKRRCGSGGGVKEGGIEIQGHHRDSLCDELVSRGYSVKRSGG